MPDVDRHRADPRLLPPEDQFGVMLRQRVPALSERQLEQLRMYRDALFEHNKVTNLTAIRDLGGIERRLILESLRLLDPLLAVVDVAQPHQASPATVLDIGTGGGLPGLVLAIALPKIEFTLLDATSKKIAFLQSQIEDIGLHNARAIHGRVEEIARDPDFRGMFSAVVARAVSSLPALIELGLPMLRLGGHLLFPKGNEIEEELEHGRNAATILGGEIVEASLLPNVGSYVETMLVIVRKSAPTPGAYPRRSGIPSRDPLRARSRNRHSGTSRRGGNRPKRS